MPLAQSQARKRRPRSRAALNRVLLFRTLVGFRMLGAFLERNRCQ